MPGSTRATGLPVGTSFSTKLPQISIQAQRAELLTLGDDQLIDVDLFHELDREEIRLQNVDI